MLSPTAEKGVLSRHFIGNRKKDDYYLLSRDLQVILMRLRTEHNHLNKHLNRLKISASPVCPWGHEDQTSEHVLQSYPQLNELRGKMWPEEIDLSSKLYGNLEELQTTAAFMAANGLGV